MGEEENIYYLSPAHCSFIEMNEKKNKTSVYRLRPIISDNWLFQWQKITPICGLDDHDEMVIPSPTGNIKTLLSLGYFAPNELKLK